MSELQFEISHGGRVRRIALDHPSAVLGRSPDCDLVVQLPSVQPRHVIFQVDPPFVRAKLLHREARGFVAQRPLGLEWSRLEPGATVRLPAASYPDVPLLIRVTPGAASAGQATMLVADAKPASPSLPKLAEEDFGVRYVTESALGGERQGWLGEHVQKPSTPGDAPATGVVSHALLDARARRHTLKRALVATSVTMIVLIAAASAIRVVQSSLRDARFRGDFDAVNASMERAEQLVREKQYAAAKAELEQARMAAARWPTMAGSVARIDAAAERPAIRLGASGHTLVDGQWLPDDVARAWLDARRRDDPRIEGLLKRASAAADAGRWDESRLASDDAMALIDAHPVKEHPRREAFAGLIARARDEAERREMTARGLVQHGGKWVTPGERFAMTQREKGLVEHKGKWLTAAQAFAARQEEKGLVFENGKWLTQDEANEAKGLVKFEGRWVAPAERDAELAKRAAAERQQRDAAARQSRRLADAARSGRQRIAGTHAEDQKELAYRKSQQFIRDQLTAPSTARFPAFDDARVTVVLVDGWYLVGAYVDAQNALGIVLRKSYVCKLRPRAAGSSTWEQETTEILD